MEILRDTFSDADKDFVNKILIWILQDPQR